MYVECRLILLIGQNSCGIVSFRCHKNRVGGLLSFKDWCFQVPHCQQVQPGCWPRGRHLPGQGDCVPDRDTLLAERWREHIRHGISYHILNFCCLRKYTAILTQTGNLNNTYDLWMSRYVSQLCPIPEVEKVQNRSSFHFHHLRPTCGKVLWPLCNSGVLKMRT